MASKIELEDMVAKLSPPRRHKFLSDLQEEEKRLRRRYIRAHEEAESRLQALLDIQEHVEWVQDWLLHRAQLTPAEATAATFRTSAKSSAKSGFERSSGGSSRGLSEAVHGVTLVPASAPSRKRRLLRPVPLILPTPSSSSE